MGRTQNPHPYTVILQKDMGENRSPCNTALGFRTAHCLIIWVSFAPMPSLKTYLQDTKVRRYQHGSSRKTQKTLKCSFQKSKVCLPIAAKKREECLSHIPTGMKAKSAILFSMFWTILSRPLVRKVPELVRTLHVKDISKVCNCKPITRIHKRKSKLHLCKAN